MGKSVEDLLAILKGRLDEAKEADQEFQLYQESLGGKWLAECVPLSQHIDLYQGCGKYEAEGDTMKEAIAKLTEEVRVKNRLKVLLDG